MTSAAGNSEIRPDIGDGKGVLIISQIGRCDGGIGRTPYTGSGHMQPVRGTRAGTGDQTHIGINSGTAGSQETLVTRSSVHRDGDRARILWKGRINGKLLASYCMQEDQETAQEIQFLHIWTCRYGSLLCHGVRIIQEVGDYRIGSCVSRTIEIRIPGPVLGTIWIVTEGSS